VARAQLLKLARRRQDGYMEVHHVKSPFENGPTGISSGSKLFSFINIFGLPSVSHLLVLGFGFSVN